MRKEQIDRAIERMSPGEAQIMKFWLEEFYTEEAKKLALKKNLSPSEKKKCSNLADQVLIARQFLHQCGTISKSLLKRKLRCTDSMACDVMREMETAT